MTGRAASARAEAVEPETAAAALLTNPGKRTTISTLARRSAMRAGVFLLLGSLAVAGGCTSITPEEQRALDEEKCRAYGFGKRNDAFAECLQRLDLERRAERRASRLALQSYDPWFHRPVIVYQERPRKLD
jgi:hypothetical protein